MAQEIVRKHASTAALGDMESRPEEDQDQEKYLVVQRNRDLLHYIVLDQAIHHGDVGTMQDMLPQLFFRFIGSGNHKYATEILETLQGFHRDWPPEVA